MESGLKLRIGIIFALLIIITVLMLNLMRGQGGRLDTAVANIQSFEDCVTAGNPVLESYPRQCRTPDGQSFTEQMESALATSEVLEPSLSQLEATTIAQQSSVCGAAGIVGNFETFNPNSGTWWFALESDKPGCHPACVVADATQTSEVNWRCTGLMQR